MFRGFPFWQVDFALRRQFKLTERVKLQLRGEAPADRTITTVAEGRTLAVTHNLGGQPAECVSFVSVVGSEPSE